MSKMGDTKEKRLLDPKLKYILDKDIRLTKSFLSFANNVTVFRSLGVHHQLLEVSCHGIVWLAVVIASIWLFGSESLYQLQVNLLIALIIDIIVVAFVKALTRRRRPSRSGEGLGPDKFSFPSGHASRAAMLACLLICGPQALPLICTPPLLAWVCCVSLSRVLARRHYILDVVAGIGLGWIEAQLMTLLWLSHNSAIYLVSWLSDEKISGGEYHV